MKIDVFTAAGAKKGNADLPASVFAAPINESLMHQAVIMQQSNARLSGAHAKTRGEIQGSTKKLFQQKGTGRARRGPIRSPVLRGGGKAFGPRNVRNFTKDMPRKMRHAAIRSCLSAQAAAGSIVGLENYPDTIKTKDLHKALEKMSLELGRRILIVLPGEHLGLQWSARNIEGVKTIYADYLNPEDVLNARHIVFLVDAIKKAEDLFGTDAKEEKKAPAKKAATKKEASTSTKS